MQAQQQPQQMQPQLTYEAIRNYQKVNTLQNPSIYQKAKLLFFVTGRDSEDDDESGEDEDTNSE